jgi:hypothetical protein
MVFWVITLLYKSVLAFRRRLTPHYSSWKNSDKGGRREQAEKIRRLYNNVINIVANQSQDCSKWVTALRWEQHDLPKRRIKLVSLHSVKARRLSFEQHDVWKAENLKFAQRSTWYCNRTKSSYLHVWDLNDILWRNNWRIYSPETI